MILRKLFVVIAGLVVIWWVLASRGERKKFMADLKGTLESPGRIVKEVVAGVSDRSSFTADNRNAFSGDASNKVETRVLSSESSPAPEELKIEEPDTTLRYVKQPTRIYDADYQSIGELSGGERVRIKAVNPENDVAVVETEHGLVGRVPLHVLRRT